MALAVVISPNGIPVSSAPSPYGFPVILASNGFGVPVTPVASGGRAVFDVGGNLFDSGSDVGPNYRMRALAGSFVFTGESMTPTAGYSMPASVGAFALTDPGTTQLKAPATPFLIDGIVHGSSGGVSLALPGLTTTKTNNIIMVTGIGNSAAVTGVTSPNLTFTRRGTSPLSPTWAYWALAASPLTNEIITIAGASTSYLAARAWAVNGAKISAPFDGTGANTPYGVPADPATITTTVSNTMVYAVWSCNPDCSAGTGFTRLPVASFGGDYSMHEYQTFTTAGTKTVTIGAPDNGSSNQGFLDAIVQGP